MSGPRPCPGTPLSVEDRDLLVGATEGEKRAAVIELRDAMPDDPGLSVTVEVNDQVRVLRLAGDLDTMSAPVFIEQFRHSIHSPAVTIDMTSVTFMDSTGIAALLTARRQGIAEGWTMTLRGLRPNVARVLSITGLDAILTAES